MALQDLERGNGFALIDPHGDLVARIAARIPTPHRDKVIYLNATDPTQPYGCDFPCGYVQQKMVSRSPLQAWMDVQKDVARRMGRVRIGAHFAQRRLALFGAAGRNAPRVLALRVLSDNEFRKGIAKSLRNETVRTFLLKEFEKFSFGYHPGSTAPI